VKKGNPKEANEAFKRGPNIYIQHITLNKKTNTIKQINITKYQINHKNTHLLN